MSLGRETAGTPIPGAEAEGLMCGVGLIVSAR